MDQEFKLDRFGDSFIQDEAEEKERRAMLKAEESATEAEKPEETVAEASGKSAMDQELIDEEILQEMLQLQLDRFGDSYIQDEAEEKGRRAALKEARENMARTKKALLNWQTKWPTKAQDRYPATMIQDDHVDTAKSALAEETAEEEEEAYEGFRISWENRCCKLDCDHFEHKTVVSSMHYTHYTPERVPYIGAETLQINSMKLKLKDDNVGGFEFPLSVYGMVAVRDALDSRRNILFSRADSEAQVLTQEDPFLHLTGPFRAILSEDKVYFEMFLRVKRTAGSQDKPLITRARAYAGGESSSTALCFDNIFCTLEVCLQTVQPAVQATIVGVQMVNKKKKLWPLNFTYGGQVACTPVPRRTTDSGGNQKIVLIESKGREMPQGDSGYVPLSRQVVCVERGGGLDVVIQAYKKTGDVAADGRVHFKAQNCLMSQQQCIVGQAQVTVTVAWSVVPTDTDHFFYNF